VVFFPALRLEEVSGSTTVSLSRGTEAMAFVVLLRVNKEIDSRLAKGSPLG
jgi:hypothetical protein